MAVLVIPIGIATVSAVPVACAETSKGAKWPPLSRFAKIILGNNYQRLSAEGMPIVGQRIGAHQVVLYQHDGYSLIERIRVWSGETLGSKSLAMLDWTHGRAELVFARSRGKKVPDQTEYRVIEDPKVTVTAEEMLIESFEGGVRRIVSAENPFEGRWLREGDDLGYTRIERREEDNAQRLVLKDNPQKSSTWLRGDLEFVPFGEHWKMVLDGQGTVFSYDDPSVTFSFLSEPIDRGEHWERVEMGLSQLVRKTDLAISPKFEHKPVPVGNFRLATAEGDSYFFDRYDISSQSHRFKSYTDVGLSVLIFNGKEYSLVDKKDVTRNSSWFKKPPKDLGGDVWQGVDGRDYYLISKSDIRASTVALEKEPEDLGHWVLLQFKDTKVKQLMLKDNFKTSPNFSKILAGKPPKVSKAGQAITPSQEQWMQVQGTSGGKFEISLQTLDIRPFGGEDRN